MSDPADAYVLSCDIFFPFNLPTLQNVKQNSEFFA